MTEQSTKELLKQSVLRMQAMRRRLEEMTPPSNEPVAIVGMGCRFPGGADTPERYWSLLRDGGVGVRDIPAERWSIEERYDPTPGKPGKMYVRQSNFLDRDVSTFDARFFKISPVEANAMDPQQRQLLEVCWEALENAGQRPDRLRGSSTGVFFGVSSNFEYGTLVKDAADVNEYIGTGLNTSVASGRIAYTFGWHGPALTLDTACSSSLVSIQLAGESLRRGDCDMALAGGVNMMLAPGVMSSLCAMNALAPDGRSKPFDASADGYGRGEGCGVVVLKRLADAERDNDTVYALIRGGAVNNDGESSGLTIPNGRAQKAVLEKALRDAEVTPDAVGYLETHGTGTLLGDPIEVDAINQVYGSTHDSDHPLVLSAAKGNIGHLESAAGVASLIKAVLSLYHGEIPPVTGLSELNPRIDSMAGTLEFPQRVQSWAPERERPRYAAVSSFGFSGTNVHMILSEAPSATASEQELPDPGARGGSLLTLSATTEQKLARIIKDHHDQLSDASEQDIEDVCYTANVCRSTFGHRAVFVGRTAAELQEHCREVLRAYEENQTLYSEESLILGSSQGKDRYNAKRSLFTTFAGGGAYTARIDEEIKPKLVFVLGGELGKTLDVARTLYSRFSVFREALTSCLKRFEESYGPQLEMFTDLGGEPADQEVGQAWLFSAEYALCKLLESYGVKPQITFGERAGSLVAAVLAGVLNLDVAIRHCIALGAARRSVEGVGYVRVLFSEGSGKETIEAALNAARERVHVSAVCSATEWILSGSRTALDETTATLVAAGANVTEDDGPWPSAAYADSVAGWYEAVDRETYEKPSKRYQSPHTLATNNKPAALQSDFRDNALTAPIRYAEGIEVLYDQGYRFFVEVGTRRSSAALLGRDNIVAVDLADDRDVLSALLHGLAKLTCLGADVTWDEHYTGQGRQKVMLPNYPFEPTRHWIANAERGQPEGLQQRLSGRIHRHGLDGEELNLPMRQRQRLFTFTHSNFAELIDNSGVVHFGYYIEMLMAALDDEYPRQACHVRDMRFLSPLLVFPDEAKDVLLILEPGAGNTFDFHFHSKSAESARWNRHVQGTAAVSDSPRDEPLAIAERKAESGRHVGHDEFYDPLERELGFHFGPAVRWVGETWPRGNAALVRFTTPRGLVAKDRAYRIGFHPGVLDGCGQCCNFIALDDTSSGKKYMVSEVDDVVLMPEIQADELYADVQIPGLAEGGDELAGSIRLVNGNGACVASIGRIRLREFDEQTIAVLTELASGAAVDRADIDSDFLTLYANTHAERKTDLVIEYVRKLLAAILQMEPADIDPAETMGNLGLDSMTGVKFFNKTNQLLGVDIQFADVIASGDLRELARRLVDLLPGGTGELQTAQTTPYDTDLSQDHWVYQRPPKPDAKIRLFCFPNGYRSADMFDDWHERLGPDVDVCPIVLPGLDAKRVEEAPPTDIEEFMSTLDRVLTPDLLDLPCATFGHSWGSLFSFRLAYRLIRNPEAQLLKTFVSGFAAPCAPNPTIVKIVDELSNHGMTRIPAYDEIRDDHEALDTVIWAYQKGWGFEEDEVRMSLPQLLAACGVIDRYQHDSDEGFTAPITAFNGVDDWVASEEMKLWEDVTNGAFSLHTMAGDHQFVNKSQSEDRLLALITDELAAVRLGTLRDKG